MLEEQGSLAVLLQGLDSGDETAARDLWVRYVPKLTTLAEHHLDPKTRRKDGIEDAVQSAFKSFFVGFRNGRYELEDWQSLGGLLARITLRKCHRRTEHYRATRRDLRREVELSSGVATPENAALQEPPGMAMALEELLDSLLTGVNETQKRVFVLALRGKQVPQISAEVMRTERTVQRILQHIRHRLETIAS